MWCIGRNSYTRCHYNVTRTRIIEQLRRFKRAELQIVHENLVYDVTTLFECRMLRTKHECWWLIFFFLLLIDGNACTREFHHVHGITMYNNVRKTLFIDSFCFESAVFEFSKYRKRETPDGFFRKTNRHVAGDGDEKWKFNCRYTIYEYPRPFILNTIV